MGRYVPRESIEIVAHRVDTLTELADWLDRVAPGVSWSIRINPLIVSVPTEHGVTYARKGDWIFWHSSTGLWGMATHGDFQSHFKEA